MCFVIETEAEGMHHSIGTDASIGTIKQWRSSSDVGRVSKTCAHELRWGCCYCRVHAGMTIATSACPECSHWRCKDCNVEFVKHRLKSDREIHHGARKPTKDPSESLLSSATRSSSPKLSQRPLVEARSTVLNRSSLSTNCISTHTTKLESKDKEKASSMFCPVYPSIEANDLYKVEPVHDESSTFSSASIKSPCTSSEILSNRLLSDDTIVTPLSTNDEVDSELDGSEKYDMDDSESEQSVAARQHMWELESFLVGLFGDNLSLVSRILPQAFNIIELQSMISQEKYLQGSNLGTTLASTIGRLLSTVDERRFTSFGSNQENTPSAGRQSSQGSSNGTSQSASSVNPPKARRSDVSNSRRKKRDRSPDDPEEPGDQLGIKRSKYGSVPGSRSFSCPFYKARPENYGIYKHEMYRVCSGVKVPEVRVDRILRHLETVHLHCDRCQYFFKEIEELEAHHQMTTPCTQRVFVHKEGIGLTQYKLIVDKFKGKMPEFLKWFEMWKIVYGIIAGPDVTPWYEPPMRATVSTPDFWPLLQSLHTMIVALDSPISAQRYSLLIQSIRQALQQDSPESIQTSFSPNQPEDNNDMRSQTRPGNAKNQINASPGRMATEGVPGSLTADNTEQLLNDQESEGWPDRLLASDIPSAPLSPKRAIYEPTVTSICNPQQAIDSQNFLECPQQVDLDSQLDLQIDPFNADTRFLQNPPLANFLKNDLLEVDFGESSWKWGTEDFDSALNPELSQRDNEFLSSMLDQEMYDGLAETEMKSKRDKNKGLKFDW